MAETKEYVAYLAPNNTILLDWNNTLWKYGYPTFPKSKCIEVERGNSEGGEALPKLYYELKARYVDRKEK